MVQRQFPKPSEVFQYLRFKTPELNGKKRRLEDALTIYDLRAIAKRRTPKAAFDYTDGPPGKSSGWRSSPGSKRPITGNDVNVLSGS